MRDYQDYLIEKLQKEEEAVAYLNASIEEYLEDGDTKALMLALEHLARAKYSITEMAKKSGVKRQHLYKILNNESNPSFSTFFAIINSLGFKLEAKLKPQTT
jgi:probable addiction module antidote protein